MQAHQRIHQSVIRAGANSQNQRFFAPIGDDIGVAHRRIEIDTLAFAQHDRVMEFGVNLDFTFDDIDEFFAVMLDQITEFAGTVRANTSENWNHVFLAQVGAKIVIIVIISCDPHRIVDGSDATTTGHAGPAIFLIFCEKVRHPDVQALTELLQLVVAQREPVMLHLR